MRSENFTLGSMRIDSTAYDHDVVIDRGRVRKRKMPPKRLREHFGHTPVSNDEEILWRWRQHVTGNQNEE